MADRGFELFVGEHGQICQYAERDELDQFRKQVGPERHLVFPFGFAPSHVLQLGSAVTSLTGVPEDFGNDADREEPQPLFFVDRLTREWVVAAAKLPDYTAGQIEQAWIANCLAEEEERPPWSTEPRQHLIASFLQLCRTATSRGTDVVMVWRL